MLLQQRVRSTAVLLALIFLSVSSLALGQVLETQECDAGGTCTTNDNDNDDQQQNNTCLNHHVNCEAWQQNGECETNAAYMFDQCPKICGVCFGDFQQQLVIVEGSMEQTDAIVKTIQATKEYVDAFTTNQTMKSFWSSCQNSLKHEQCSEWAAIGECTANPSFMKTSCAAACQCCDLFDIRVRCPLSEASPNAWSQPGDLNQFFVNLTTINNNKETNPYYSPDDLTILSQPPDGPWVVTIDNFLSEEETTQLVALGEQKGYARSYGVGKIRDDGTVTDEVVSGRTSSNTWCQDDCANDETAVTINARIANLTMVPGVNQEHLQLLKYKVGQFYRIHHDYIPIHSERQPGVRILTVFFYLNDVEAGGGTRFPLLNGLTVLPKRGRVLIWPSVLDEDPHKKDRRTQHEALTVDSGLKYAANAWIHQRDYVKAHAKACQ